VKNETEEDFMKRTSIMGISMTSRSRRRMLVFIVYFLLAIFVVLGVALHRDNLLLKPGDFLSGFNLLFVILFTGVSRLIFGSLIEQTTFPVPPQEGPGDGRPISLFGSARPMGSPDERDLEVRNRAYFQSFRMIAVYSVLLWFAYSFLNAFWMPQVSLNIAALLLFPLIVMAITLPQALLLWSEPDVPAPDEEMSSASAR
jgi:hypothetical protein